MLGARIAGLLLVVAAVALGVHVGLRRAQAVRLVRTWPERIEQDETLRGFALGLARPVFATHCSPCHGATGEGLREHGTPDLTAARWLYGDGGVASIERTILYGIRSGHPKAHNLTDMPAAGRIHQLTAAEVADVVQFVRELSQQPHSDEAATRGRSLYYDKGNCYDCHAADARGNSDYGAPSLHGPSWQFGGDSDSLFASIYSGRHGLCPAWIGRLQPVQIRALAVYLHQALPPPRSAAPWFEP